MKKKLFVLLFIFVSSTAGFIYFAGHVSPFQTLFVANYKTQPLLIFFLLLFLAASSLFSVLLKSIRRGIFAGVFVVSYLLLQMHHLTNILYIVLLIGIFLALELVFFKNKHKE